MSRFEIGPIVLMVPDHAGIGVEATDFEGASHHAVEAAGVVAGDPGMLLETVHQGWDLGGQAFVASRGDSSPGYDRLVGRLRLGMKSAAPGVQFCELGIVQSDAKNPFGSVRQATLTELDFLLGDSAAALFTEAGALDVGTREEVLGDTSRRRNYLCVTFQSGDSTVPLVAHTLTRVLPVFLREADA